MTAQLEATARAIVAGGKGILAADESSGTIKKRFDSIGAVTRTMPMTRRICLMNTMAMSCLMTI